MSSQHIVAAAIEHVKGLIETARHDCTTITCRDAESRRAPHPAAGRAPPGRAARTPGAPRRGHRPLPRSGRARRTSRSVGIARLHLAQQRQRPPVLRPPRAPGEPRVTSRLAGAWRGGPPSTARPPPVERGRRGSSPASASRPSTRARRAPRAPRLASGKRSVEQAEREVVACLREPAPPQHRAQRASPPGSGRAGEADAELLRARVPEPSESDRSSETIACCGRRAGSGTRRAPRAPPRWWVEPRRLSR